jgi:hypothetical protein
MKTGGHALYWKGSIGVIVEEALMVKFSYPIWKRRVISPAVMLRVLTSTGINKKIQIGKDDCIKEVYSNVL